MQNILSIAGFDPSNGAGIGADIKTAEMNSAYCLAVASALTFQNESEFDGLQWTDKAGILRQMEVLFRKHDFKSAKIGLIENIAVLTSVIDLLKSVDPETPIIWDPIVRASAGFWFHQQMDFESIKPVLQKLYLVTPNKDEAEQIFGSSAIDELQTLVKEHGICNILLKGGHSNGSDAVITADSVQVIEGEKWQGKSKHGTGCILSSAIASALANGIELYEACVQAKRYTEKIILSNNGLLGYHAV